MNQDESMAKKYALPEDYDNKSTSASKKRRGADEWEDDSQRDKGSSSTGGANKANDGKAKGAKEEGKGGKGGKAGGRGGKGGKGGGKGNNWSKGGDFTVNQSLSVHAKMLLRLDQEKRERDRTAQWAIDFKLPYSLPKVLTNAVEVYRKAKPEEGPHPEGSLNDVQWGLFATAVYADMEKIDANSANKERLNLLCKFLRESVYPTGELGPEGNRTVCGMFKPAHRVSEESTTWTWLFRIRQDISRGRDVHEQLLVCSRYIADFHTHINIRKDRAPKDGLIRQVETQLANMRV